MKSTLPYWSRNRPHFERLLLVCAGRNAGKSTLIRSMFLDPRLNTSGRVFTGKRPPVVALSRERCLRFQISSPHESGQSIDEYLKSIDRMAETAWRKHWRFNLVTAIQPNAANRMPDVVETTKALIDAFHPERIRILQLHPRQDSADGDLLSQQDVARLIGTGIEVVTIDARQHSKNAANAFFLSDFFDFT